METDTSKSAPHKFSRWYFKQGYRIWNPINKSYKVVIAPIYRRKRIKGSFCKRRQHLRRHARKNGLCSALTRFYYYHKAIKEFHQAFKKAKFLICHRVLENLFSDRPRLCFQDFNNIPRLVGSPYFARRLFIESEDQWVCADDAISGITNLVMPLLALLIILASRARYVHSYVSYRHTQVPTGRYWCPLSGP